MHTHFNDKHPYHHPLPPYRIHFIPSRQYIIFVHTKLALKILLIQQNHSLCACALHTNNKPPYLHGIHIHTWWWWWWCLYAHFLTVVERFTFRCSIRVVGCSLLACAMLGQLSILWLKNCSCKSWARWVAAQPPQ